jgi:hypothetical protein
MTWISTAVVTGRVTTVPGAIVPVGLCPCPPEGTETELQPATRIPVRTRIPITSNDFIKMDSAGYYFILLKLST